MTDTAPSPRGQWVPMRLTIYGACGCDWQYRETSFEHADHDALSDLVKTAVLAHAKRTGHGPRYVETVESGFSMIPYGEDMAEGAQLEPTAAG